jgi:hypothetical protein
MGTALVVMLVLFGVFVGIPLWLAWLSATGRFDRVERALGAEPRHRRPSRWAWAWPAAAAGFYAVVGGWQLAQGWRVAGVVSLATAGVWGLQVLVVLWLRRRSASQGMTGGTPRTGAQPPSV